MAYLCVDKNNSEWIWNEEPNRGNVEFATPFDSCDVISLPKGTIEKITGRVLTWDDEPVEI